MAVPKLLTLILGFIILTLCQCILGQSLDWQSILQADVDIYNSTSLDQYALATRRKYTTQARSFSPNMTSDTLAASLQDSFRGISLRPRQACTGNVNNYCFGNNDQYCSDCGICCTQSAGPWCCITNGGAVTKTCCPADTGLTTGHQGCCDTWQSCRDDTGCTDPSTTITTTVISWTTLYTTTTVYTTRFSTSTYIASAYTTVYTTVSNAQTATKVDYVTVTANNRRRRGVEAAGETNRAHPTSWTKDTPTLVELDSDPTGVMSIQAPIITVLSYPELDLVARDLEALGVIVKRQNTITITVTVTSSGTTILPSTFTSTVVENVVATSTTNLIITSTTYIDAQTTTRVTSTITTRVPASDPDPASSTTTNANENASTSTSASAGSSSSTGTGGRGEEEGGGGGGDLSTAAQVGIGVGTAGGSSIICIILLFWWRRRRRAQKDGGAQDPSGRAAMAQGTGPNPSSNLNSNSQPLYTAIGTKSELESESTLQHNNNGQRQSFQPSSPSTGVGGHSMSYSYEPVNRSDGLAEVPGNEDSPAMGYRPPQSPSPQFQYAPYELYDERSHELDASQSR